MHFKNIIFCSLLATPMLASANSITEPQERMVIEQQAIAYTVSGDWAKLGKVRTSS